MHLTTPKYRQLFRKLPFAVRCFCHDGSPILPNDHNVIHGSDPDHLLYKQEHERTSGVFRNNEQDDVSILVSNYTAPSLAKALHDRETTLQLAAELCSSGKMNALADVLSPFLKTNVEKRRNRPKPEFHVGRKISRSELALLQRYLQRLPRQVFRAAAERRASVVIPLCNVNGVASIMFERRSMTLRTHKGQVCFPGGMVDEDQDYTVVESCLREMYEELGIPPNKTEILGVLRCNWSEVSQITGVAVTPVVGFVGELSEISVDINPDEVEQWFTVPLADLLDKANWEHREFSAPVFTGGPFVIWGLTAYLLERFLLDVVTQCNLSFSTDNSDSGGDNGDLCSSVKR